MFLNQRIRAQWAWRRLIFVILFFLAGCCCSTNTVVSVQSREEIFPLKVAGASDAKVMVLMKKLTKEKVVIVTMGQNYLVSLPTRVIFYKHSPRICWQCYAVLNDVACYLKQFRKVVVAVTGYTGKTCDPMRDRALALARAEAVSDYIVSQGIDARFLYTQGLGNDKPIQGNGVCGGEGNSRIEITFKDVIV